MLGRFINRIFSPAAAASIKFLTPRVNHCTIKHQLSYLTNSGLSTAVKCRTTGGITCKTINSVFTPQNRPILAACTPLVETVRTRIYVSRNRGKPKTIQSVINRFKRLDWGAWIRPKVGRKKYLWKKSEARKYRSRQHVFCNKQQCKMLDKMVTDYWKKKKFYVDDPYEPYQKRTNMPHLFPEKPPFLP